LTPAVSVIINTNGRADSLRRTLLGLDALEYPRFEVVVVVGPDRDGFPAALEGFADRIVIVETGERNLSVSRNLGIRAAHGRYVAFIDDDAIPDPWWLSDLIPTFENDEVAATGGPVFDFTGGRLQVRYSTCTRGGLARAMTSGPNPSHTLSAPESWTIPYTIGTNSLFRRSAVVSCGGFDEAFAYYLDETDLCMRLVDAGFRVELGESGHVYHQFAPSSMRSNERIVTDWRRIVWSLCYFAARHGLPRAGFGRTIQDVSAWLHEQRAGVDLWIAHGLTEASALELFDAQVSEVSQDGWEQGARGAHQIRPPAWFDADPDGFVPFPRDDRREPRLHICIVSAEYPPHPVNGIGRVMHQLATGLRLAGHIVRVIAEQPREDLLEVDRDDDGVWVHRVPRAPGPPPSESSDIPHQWGFAEAVRREVDRIHDMHPLDVVHSANWNSEGLEVMTRGTAPTSLVLVTSLTTLIDTDARFRDASEQSHKQLLEREAAAYGAADVIVASTDAIRDDLSRRFPTLDERGDEVRVIPFGVPSAPAANADTPGPDDATACLFVGRLEPRKGIDVILDAIALIEDERDDVRFTIVGDDSQQIGERTAREAFEAEHPTSRTRFLGRLDDEALFAEYVAADVVVMPSRYESYGLPILEAARVGVPAVASGVGGLKHLVVDGETGLLVPPDDPRALADALLALVDDPERRDRMGEAARTRFERRYSVASMVSSYENLFAGLASANRSPEQRSPDARTHR